MAATRSRFKISIFLSYPKPFTQSQEVFLEAVCDYLDGRGLAPRTLGVTDYDMDAPMKAIRRLMLESNGLIALAFRRLHVLQGRVDSPSTREGEDRQLNDRWLTSPWAHIEPAMAYQLGLPILILREQGAVSYTHLTLPTNREV